MRICKVTKSKLPVGRRATEIATSSGAEGMKVKRKNFSAALGPSLRPYMAIRMAMGTSDSSQKP